jgi:hypothetical protein
LVEQAAGRRFERLPTVSVVDPDTLARVVYAEQLHLLARRKGLAPGQAEAHAARSADAMRHAAFGKYGFLDGHLYVDPAGIRAALPGASDQLLAAVLDLVLAHELTHALQDQELDLARLAQDRVGDEGIAVVCALEGHAAWVQMEVARELVAPDGAAVIAALLGYDASNPQHSTSPATFHDSYVYGQGTAFVASLEAKGGTERTWQVLARPPVRTAMVVHPDRYAPAAKRPPARLLRAARTARAALASSGWTEVEEPLGDYNVRRALVSAGTDPALADDLETGWSTRAYGAERLGLDVQTLVFRDVERAMLFAAAMEVGAAATVDATRASSGVLGALRHLDVPGADSASVERFGLMLPGLPTEHVATALAVRGRVVTQIVLVNVEVDDAQLALALRGLVESAGRVR